MQDTFKYVLVKKIISIFFFNLRLNFKYKRLYKWIKGYSSKLDLNRDILYYNFLNNYLEEVSNTIKFIQFYRAKFELNDKKIIKKHIL